MVTVAGKSGDEPARRRSLQLAVWTATHDNGWETTVSENVDHTFSAWAAPFTGPVRIDYVEDGPENAMRAAEFALRRKTGHDQCSRVCSGWTRHSHTIDVGESAEEV
jgi:hypothetical protein